MEVMESDFIDRKLWIANILVFCRRATENSVNCRKSVDCRLRSALPEERRCGNVDNRKR